MFSITRVWRVRRRYTRRPATPPGPDLPDCLTSLLRLSVVGAAALVLLSLQALAVALAVTLDALLLPIPWLRSRLLPTVLEELAAGVLPLEQLVDRLSSQISLRHVQEAAAL